jgi:hypothetical protein
METGRPARLTGETPVLHQKHTTARKWDHTSAENEREHPSVPLRTKGWSTFEQRKIGDGGPADVLAVDKVSAEPPRYYGIYR